MLRLILLAALPLAAQNLHIVNGNVQARAASAGLEQQVRSLAASAAPVWIAWAVPRVEGGSNQCTVSLEAGYQNSRGEGTPRPGGQLLVFLRASQGNIEKIRGFGEECDIDAGGRTVHLLTGVRPADSVNYLAGFATGGDKKLSDGAVFAIAQHDDAAADAALDRFTEPGQSEALRERTVFWLGAARGRRGYERLARLVKNDPSDRIREKVVFALYVSKEPQAVDAIIDAARNDKSQHVRGQALFWLGQKAGKKATAALADAVANDPDTEIKKKAVFALSQLKDGEGVTKLIEVARTNKSPAVRKQAMFWLGQSKDPRALDFFADILRQP